MTRRGTTGLGTGRRLARTWILPALLFCGSWFAAPQLPAQLIGGGGGSSGAGGAQIFELQRGIGLLRKGENAAAKAHFEAMAARFPSDSMAPYYGALSAAALGETKATIVALRSAVERGWEDPEGWRKDSGFASLREKDPKFTFALESLLQSIDARREKGVIEAFPFGALTYLDLFESEHTFAESEGKPRAVLFLDGEGDTLTALWSVEALLKEHGDAVTALVLVECRGKGARAQLDRLGRFQLENHIELPIGLATAEQRRALRPWHSFPTLLMLDRKSRAAHVVEGFPANLEDRYRAAFDAVLAPKSEDEGKQEPAREGSPPAESKKEKSSGSD